MPDRRDQILDVAESVFAERGYAQARIDDIAERAGLAHGTIYRYFASKQELFGAVLEARLEEMNRRLAALCSETRTAGALVEALVAVHWEFLRAHGRLVEVGLAHLPTLPDSMRARIKELRRTTRELLIRAVAAVLPPHGGISPAVAADALAGAVGSVVMCRFWEAEAGPDREASLRGMQEELKALLVPGLSGSDVATGADRGSQRGGA